MEMSCQAETLTKKTTSAHWNLLSIVLSAERTTCEHGSFVEPYLASAASCMPIEADLTDTDFVNLVDWCNLTLQEFEEPNRDACEKLHEL